MKRLCLHGISSLLCQRVEEEEEEEGEDNEEDEDEEDKEDKEDEEVVYAWNPFSLVSAS